MRLTRIPFAPGAAIPGAWSLLYRALPQSSVFVSPVWMQTWAEIYGPAFQGEWMVWEEDGAPVGAVLFLHRRGKLGPFPVRLAVLNTGAEDGTDGPYAEYNDVLCLPRFADAVAASLAQALKQARWDQLLLSGYAEGSVMERLVAGFHANPMHHKRSASPFTALERVRQEGHEALLSTNTRKQIARSLKLYAARGAVRVEVARSAAEAQQFLEALARLHRAAWAARGVAGAFGGARFDRFHRLLVERLWPEGSVDLLRVAAGEQEIGFLYNFKSSDRIYFYQSGLAYENDNRLKPGLVAHSLAIKHYAAAGAGDYELLAGDSRYKRSLSTAERSLTWTTIDRASIKMRVLRGLAELRDRGRGLRHQSAGKAASG